MLSASRLVLAVFNGRNLTEAWEEMLAGADWPATTRGAVRDLAWSTLREYGAGDFILSALLQRPPAEELRALLLVALHRLRARPEQAHVIVDQAVEAVASFAPGLRGVTNGVLRNALRSMREFDARIARDETARLCHPAWWIARLKHDHPQHWEAVAEAGNRHPPMGLRVNRRRTDRDTYQARLAQAGIASRAWGEDGLLLERPLPVAELPDFGQGLVSVQDLGAQQAAMLLDGRDGERVLDACAAPGGKTAHMLERADLRVTALDIDPTRLARVRDNLDRLGLSADVVCGDAARPRQWWDGVPYDRILADVPCSASGVVRRHPDIKWLRRDDDIAGFAARQAALLEALWPLLAPGGTMLYATCSVFEEENGARIAAFCNRHPDVERLPLHGRMDLQLLPNAEHDGFYYALLRKHA